MEPVNSLLQACEEKGLQLSLKGPENDQLVVEFDEAPPEQLLASLKSHKSVIIEHLRSLQCHGHQQLIDLPIKQQQHESVPLSDQQRSMFFVGELQDDHRNYNMIKGYQYDGRLCTRRAHRALIKLIQKHPILNISVTNKNGVPEQHFNAAETINEDALIISQRLQEADDLATVMASLWLQEHNHRFGFDGQPLLRLTHLKASEQTGVLLFNLHHLVADGGSISVLVDDFVKLYQNDDITGLNADITYFDYVLWQQTQEVKQALTQQLSYWQNKLQDAPQLHQLPTDHIRPAVKSLQGRSHESLIDPELVNDSMAFARAEGVTPFILFHAVWAMLVARYSGQKDVIIGTPTAGRDHPQLSSMVGLLVNMVALRSDFSNEMTVRDFLSANRAEVFSALAHRDVSFDQVIEMVNPQRSLSHSPLVQIVFSMESMDSSQIELPGLTLEQLDFGEASSKFDLDLKVKCFKDDIKLVFNYDPELFNTAKIEQLATHFQRMLQEVVKNPESPISRLNILTDIEQQSLFEKFQPLPQSKKPLALHQLVEQQVWQHPDQVALDDDTGSMTYQQLDAMANGVANHLLQQGIQNNQLVAIGYARSNLAVVAMLGVLKAGAAYVPIDPSLPESRIQFICQDAEISYLLTEDLKFGVLSHRQASVTELMADGSWSTEPPDVAVSPADLAYVIYTSGSTGDPKGVMIEHQNVVALIRATQHHFDFQCGDRFSAFHSTSFDFSVWEIFAALCNGATVCVVNTALTKDPEAFANWLEDSQVTVLSQTPSVFYEVSGFLAAKQAHAIRVVIFGGEALETTRLSQWFEAESTEHVALINMYGITETTVHVTIHPVAKYQADSIGQGLPGYQTYVVNEAGMLQPNGVPGELWVGGCGVARGYLNRPSLTEQRFVEVDLGFGTGKVYKTGDLVVRNGHGDLSYLGRIDQQIKIRGFRIEPGEIESRLCELSMIDQAVVIKMELQSGDQLIAFVTLQGLSGLEQTAIEQIKAHLTEELPGYMVPHRFISVDHIPLTSNGKVDHKQLHKLLVDRNETQESSDQFQTATEKQLMTIWQELLNLQHITRLDDFFSLGGHSLLVAKLVAAINEHWQIQLNLQQVFAEPQLATMAKLIDAQEKVDWTIETVEEGQVSMASFAQQSVWLACQTQHASSKYNIPIALKLEGRLNQEALRSSLRTLVSRHDALRMSFHLNASEQLEVRVAKTFEFELPIVDCFEEKAFSVTEIQKQEALTPFDLGNDLLFRARLLCLDDSTHVLLLTIHHIVADGWSIDRLYEEFCVLYNAHCLRRPDPLPKPAVRYQDYAHWQRKHVDESRLNADLVYWQSILQQAPVTHSLPIDRPRNYSGKRQAGVFKLTLSNEQYQRMKSLATAQECSVFALLQSALGLLIGLQSNEGDVVLGSPVIGRDTEALQQMVGLAVNTLLFRHRFNSETDFIALLKNTHQQLVDGTAHLNAPFDWLVSKLNCVPNQQHAPLCQIVLNFMGHQLPHTPLHHLRVSDISDEYEIADLDLHITARETDVGLGLRWLFAKDIFDESTLQSLAEQLPKLLDWLCENPQLPFRMMPLADPEEYATINLTDVDFADGLLVHEMVERSAELHPDQQALYWRTNDGDMQLSYQQLNEQANQLARYLQQKNVGSHDRVGICLSRSGDFVVAMLAIMKLGASFVPMEPDHPAEHLKHIAQDAEVKAIVTTQAQMQRFDFLSPYPLVLMDPVFRQALLGGLDQGNLSGHYGTDAIAYNIYTSGTTGKPKGVSVKHSALMNLMNHEVERFDLQSDSRVIHAFSMGFDPGIGHLFSALSAGCQVYICPLRDDVAEFIDRHQLTHVSLPTALLQSIKPGRFDSVLLVSAGGEYCSQQLAETWSQCHRFFNLYGPTEATVYAMSHEFRPGDQISIGQPVANTKCYVINRFGQVLPPGVAGELVITGAAIDTHYLASEQLDDDRYMRLFIGGEEVVGFRTGDLVVFNTQFHYLGRLDAQLKISGYRIEPAAIEQHMLNYEGVDQVFVTSVERTHGQRQLLAYFTADAKRKMDSQKIIRHLHQVLPAYSVPSVLLQLEKFPVTVNGKIDSNALPVPNFEPQQDVPPKNDSERLIQSMWMQVLKLEKLSMNAEFFESGGNSLMAMMLVSEVKEKFDIEFEVTDVFDTKTAAGMAQLIAERQALLLDEKNIEMEW